MSCTSPLTLYRHPDGSTGTKRLYLKQSGFQVPCGQCMPCRLRKSAEWAVRIMQENRYWHSSCFVTLTYDPEDLPSDHSLCHEHFQKFMKRLRKNTGLKLKYFMCGEYGEKLSRPHYHAIIFGWEPDDQELLFTRDGLPHYKSDLLTDTWQKGFCTVSEVTHDSAGYVARYCTKKVTGDRAAEHYCYVDEYGLIWDNLKPEYIACSNGIGERHFKDWYRDIYPSDEMGVVKNGDFYVTQPPRYFDELLKRTNRDWYEEVKKKRETRAQEHQKELTPDRLRQIDICYKDRNKRLPRKLEESQPCVIKSSQSTTVKLRPIYRRSSSRTRTWLSEHLRIASIRRIISSAPIQPITRLHVSVNSKLKLESSLRTKLRQASGLAPSSCDLYLVNPITN